MLVSLPLLLAEVDPHALKTFFEVGLYVVGAVLAVAALVAVFRRKGATQIAQPLVVAAEVRFTPLELHKQLQQDVEALRDQRRADVAGLHKKIEDGLSGLRTDLASEFKEVRQESALQRESIAHLKSETAQQTRQILNLDGKVDHLPEKVVTLLGGLRK